MYRFSLGEKQIKTKRLFTTRTSSFVMQKSVAQLDTFSGSSSVFSL